ncbi:MAG TPA: hypothetical protein VNH64_01685, partial [Parvularculaceae bacterium]|nr:hypothetical protein [Parvularculaceae bacterium]
QHKAYIISRRFGAPKPSPISANPPLPRGKIARYGGGSGPRLFSREQRLFRGASAFDQLGDIRQAFAALRAAPAAPKDLAD